VQIEPGDAPARHPAGEASDDGLDFGKLGHLRLLRAGSVALGGARRYGAAMATPETSGETDFGFERVPLEEKPRLVRRVFDAVAPRYDLMNDLMSAGVHRLWKSEMIRRLNPRPGQRLLDVAGGTGDIAERFVASSGSAAIVCDVNQAMLQAGRDRAIDRGRLGEIAWLCGDAEALPIAPRSVDAVTIAFGLRNVTRMEAALAEMRRVLRPGGRFLCLEFSRVGLPGLARLYDLYSFNVLPRIGAVVTGDREAYQYLVESIRRFPDQQELARRMAAAGFERVTVRNLSGGIAALHSGWRL
jgi:demethylmenaquinone methyltransferase/2-methoxy-6-polyprenyl-1,4-benzoquinol methylase